MIKKILVIFILAILIVPAVKADDVKFKNKQEESLFRTIFTLISKQKFETAIELIRKDTTDNKILSSDNINFLTDLIIDNSSNPDKKIKEPNIKKEYSSEANNKKTEPSKKAKKVKKQEEKYIIKNPKKYYITTEIGMRIPSNDINSSFPSGLMFNLGYQHNFDEILSLETKLGYVHYRNKNSEQSFYEIPFALGFKVRIDDLLSVNLGPGVSYLSYDLEQENVKISDNKFVFNAFAGLNISGESFEVGSDYIYQKVDDINFGGTNLYIKYNF